MNNEHNHQEALDAATARRLALLGERATDTTGLEDKLNAAFADDDTTHKTTHHITHNDQPLPIRHWLRPAASIAAAIALAVTLFVAIGTNTPQASAAVVELSQLHRDIVSGHIPLSPVTSATEANEWIASQQATAPALPEQLAGTRVQSCCLTEVRGKLAAVAVLQDANATVTLVVAEAPGFAHEMGTLIEIDGRRFFGHELNGTRMMMANQGDRWLCVMGDLTYDQLANLAAKIEF